MIRSSWISRSSGSKKAASSSNRVANEGPEAPAPTAGADATRDVGQEGVVVVDVLEHIEQQGDIEGPVGCFAAGREAGNPGESGDVVFGEVDVPAADIGIPPPE